MIGASSQIGCERLAAGRRAGRRGFSLAELLVVIGIIALLASLILSTISRTRQSAQSTQCMANLHSIGIAFSQYAIDNNNRYPSPIATGASWENLLRRYLTQPLVFACPADDEVFVSVGSSYDWRDTPDAVTTAADKRVLDVTRANAVLAFETLPGWHARHQMNALLADGGVVMMSDDECLGDLQLPITAGPWPSSSKPALR